MNRVWVHDMQILYFFGVVQEFSEGCPHYYIGVQVDISFQRVVHNTKISIGIGGLSTLLYRRLSTSFFQKKKKKVLF